MTPTIPDVVQKTILEEAKEKFGRFRESVVDAMAVLYDVQLGEAWKQVADSWGEYVESELQISQSFASKLLSTYKYFVIEQGVSQEKLIGVDYEKLNMARSLPGTVEEQLAKASSLTRSELKLERQDAEPHQYEPVEYCKICHGSKENHN